MDKYEISDVIREWRIKMREAMFAYFKSEKHISPVIMMLKGNTGGISDNIIVPINGIENSIIPDILKDLINDRNPDAYIIMIDGNVLLTEDEEAGVDKIKDAGSVANVDESKEVAVFMFETKTETHVEMYEVIRIDDDAVISDKPLEDFTEVNGIFSGHLNKGVNVKADKDGT